MNHKSILLQGRILEINKPLTMGVVNLTRDSFYKESRSQSGSDLLKRVEKMIEDGMDILDLGAYSTRPGADEIPEEHEMKRLCKSIEILRREFDTLIISADTFRANIAREAVRVGADIINDIGGGNLDNMMFDTIAELEVPYILMHSRGTPQTMKELSQYTDVVNDVIYELQEKINTLRLKGVRDILVDPGFGFAKSISQNFEMLKRLDEFKIFNCPLLIGISRKSMIWKTLKITPSEALNGTSFLNTIALEKGAAILRVHDVKEAAELIRLQSEMLKIEKNGQS